MVRLIAVGDISLRTRKNITPFGKVAKAFRDKDILFGNLETTLSNQGKKSEKSVLLFNDPEKLEHLKDAGFDILNVANNHIMDLGLRGFNKTLNVLDGANLAFIGATNHRFTRSHSITKRKNIRLGFLGYWEGGFKDTRGAYEINKIDEVRIVRDIASIKENCDVVIISLHWGVENVFYPSPKQIELARLIIDKGATVVLGHHSHVVQGIELYKHGLIAYSLGNFQFDFDNGVFVNDKVGKSFILFINVSSYGVESYDVLPIKINHENVPNILDGEEQDDFLRFISEISKRIIEGKVTATWWFEEIASTYFLGNMKSWLIRIKKYGLIHAIQWLKWLVSPFVIRCYFGMIRRLFKKR